MDVQNEKLKNACEAAFMTFKKINTGNFDDISSKLEYCIGSYNFDKNPVGLLEFGNKALVMLKDYKKDNPRKVTKKVVDDLEKSLSHN